MRVISGTHRGRTLHAPKGTGTRPTTDRVRESLFSALASMRGGFEGAVVLDAFAGSGALGVEALSRGAAFACFCEKDRNALAALQSNTSFLDPGSFAIARGDTLKRVPVGERVFDIVLFDPPYSLDPQALVDYLDMLRKELRLSKDVIVSYEHDASAPEGSLLASACALELASVKRYGSTAIDLYCATA